MFPHTHQDDWLDSALRLQPGKPELTSAQEAEARRFAEAYMQEQLSTEPVHEQEAEALLRQAYQVAGLAPPQHIQWVDSPLQLVAVLTPLLGQAKAMGSLRASIEADVWHSVRARVRTNITASITASVVQSVRASVVASLRANAKASLWRTVRASITANVGPSSWHLDSESIQAYFNAPLLALYQFFDVYLAPNDLHALARFNQLVSGYVLGSEAAVMVRRPSVLSLDAEGRLHSATDRCMEYHDGWGFYCWHGVRMPEQVILAPERLSREDFLSEPNVEVRRVIQERMGSRFVTEVGGQVIESSPRGTLYEVRLPEDDPERVARYVQVQDASSKRQYFLRVPPTIQTAAEAVAWSFELSGEDYHPAQET